MKDELTMQECKNLLKVSESTVKRLLKNGELEPVYKKIGLGKGGRRRLISSSSAIRYIAKNKECYGGTIE